MKKNVLSRILSLAMCACLVCGMLPMNAIAATTENGIITLTPADLVDGASGEGWSFRNNQLTINSGYTLNFEGECSVSVLNNGTISGGTFSGKLTNNQGSISGITIELSNALIQGGESYGWSLDGNNNLILNSGITYYWKSGEECGYRVENKGTITGGNFGGRVHSWGAITGGTFSSQVDNDGTITDGTFSGMNCFNHGSGTITGGTFSSQVDNDGTIEGGNFSGSVDNDSGATISGGVFTEGMDNSGTVTGAVDLSALGGFSDHSGQYGKQVKLPKAVIRGDLTYIGCDPSTQITLHYYGDDVKTAEWTVSGERYSYPVEKYKRTDPDADLSAIEGIAHEVKAVPMDGYEITIDNPIWDRFNITVSSLITGTDETITYDGSTYDVSQMFTVHPDAGAASYTIVGGTGAGSLNGSVLTITKAGTIIIQAQGENDAGEATATLTVNKGTPQITVSIEGWTYGEEPNAPASDGPGDVTYTYDNSAGALGGTEPPTDAGMWVVVATYTGNDLYKDGWEFVWFTIEQKELTPAITGSVSKTYDGTTAVPDGLSITLSGVITGDDVSATATYAYESADIGTTKIVATITLNGSDAKNYKVATTASADVGEILPAPHVHSYGTEWKSDGMNHWHECTCGAKTEEAAHSGGTATCKDKAVCSTCGTAYGDLAAHTYASGKCTVCEAADPNYVPETDSPKTGDNSHMALWSALLFISGGALIALTAVDRKRRRKA